MKNLLPTLLLLCAWLGTGTAQTDSPGAVVAWGYNVSGETTVPVAAQSGVTAIAARGSHTLALKNDGSVVAWGRNGDGQTTVPVAAQSGVMAIAAGYSHTVALKNDGSVVAWGNNYSGQSVVPAGLSGVTAVAAGFGHTVALVLPTAPVITTQPVSQTVNVGQGASFTVVASGHSLDYQWRKDGANLGAATSATYRLTDVQTYQAGAYTVVVNNSLGAATSAPPAVLTVNVVAPAGGIYFWSGQSPAPADSYVRLCTTISGVPYPSFQWQFQGSNLPGQDSTCIGLSYLSSNQAGLYRLIASNVAGVFTSAPIALAVSYAAPAGAIYFSSGQSPAPAESSVVLCTTISGAPAPSFQWQFNGLNLPGEKESCLWRSGLSSNQAGIYRLVASNSVGVFTSAPIALVVSYSVPAGEIYFGSGQSPAPANSSVTFCTTISGAPYPSFQWQFNGVNLPGQNGLCLWLSGVSSNQAGLYRLVASNSVGVFTSAPIALAVDYLAPTGSIYFSYGQSPAPAESSVVLCATISAAPYPTFQWQFNGENLPGQNGWCLGLAGVSSNQAGLYRLVASNSLGVFTSAPIALAVRYAPPTGSIFFNDGHSPAPAGSSVILCSTISAAPPAMMYQWQFQGVNLSGQIYPCLELYGVSSNQAGLYRLVASNSVGVFTSAPIALAVSYSAPTGNIYLASGPSPVLAGTYLVICAMIGGVPSPSFQWQFNGMNLPGQNSSCLSVDNVSSNQAGLYRLVASNSAGVLTSAPIALAVSYVAPTGSIYFDYGQSPAPAGSSVNLCSTISAGPPPAYQWQFEGVALPGENGSCLSLYGVSSNQAGLYRLVASNSVGVFTSAPIALAVDYFAPFGSISPSGALPPILAGSSLWISSTIYSGPYPAFQWQFNEVDLPGQNEFYLSLDNVQTNQSGNYRLIASNFLGSFTSAVAVVSVVYEAPTATIFLDGGHSPTTVGSSLGLCASVSGAPAPTVQWQFNGTNLPGKNGRCLYLSNLQTNQSGAYTFVASNIVGVVTSLVAAISVTQPVPVLAYFAYGLPPVAVGSGQNLYAETALPEPATLQWRFNGTNLLEATNYWYWIYPVQAGDAGEYSVVATTPTSGVYTSPPIALTVYYAPPWFAQPEFILGSPSALVGEDVSLEAYYAGSPSFVQWRFNGVNLPGETNGSLALLAITTNQAGQYSFTASNLAGMTTSSVVTLNVSYQPPDFASHPFDQSVMEGTTARFEATASGGPPPEYYLELDGTNVAVPFTYERRGGTGGFSLLDTTFADAGSYRIIASNFLGSATSIVATLTVTPAGPLDRWTQRNPLPQSQPLLAVAHGPNQFVAVGERGTILTSPDGSNWALQNRRADVPLSGVAHGDGLFVAVGAGGTILSSSDGTNWAYRYTVAKTPLNAVTYGAGHFVVVGSAPGLSTLVLHSSDGLHWERIPLNGFFAQQCVAYGNGLFIAAGGSSVMRSSDGTNWTLALTFNKQIESVTFADGKYVAVGDDGSMLVSTDGVSWASHAPVTPRRLLSVIYGAGRFVAAGARGTMLTSTDAITWTAVASGTPDRLETIDYSAGLFVAAGENGTIITSTNGTTWTKQNFGITRDLDGMFVANGTLVVVGKGGSILTSTDGVVYTTQNAGVTNDLHGVTWGGGLWVAVGEPGIVLTSSNAVDWMIHDPATTNSLKDATYADGQWIVVGTQGTIVRSTNGVNWATTFTTPGRDLNDVAFGNGVYLVVGDGPGGVNGSLFVSSNGVEWDQVNFYTSQNWRGVTFANGLFLITANDGVVVTTSTALNFDYNLPFGASYEGLNLRAATWAQGLWIVVGNNGVIFTSPDLLAWTLRASRTFENQHQVALLDGKLVVIGNRGGVLQSGRFVTELEPPVFLPGIGFQLPFKGMINQAYQVQASTNLMNWNTLLTFTNITEHNQFTDTNALLFPQRFYRLVEP